MLRLMIAAVGRSSQHMRSLAGTAATSQQHALLERASERDTAHAHAGAISHLRLRTLMDGPTERAGEALRARNGETWLHAMAACRGTWQLPSPQRVKTSKCVR
eukprot:scaffold7804_cov390-Prasinococcus_capsulatus_cf.AAC.1